MTSKRKQSTDEGLPRPLSDKPPDADAGGLQTLLRNGFAVYDGRSPTILSEISVRYRDRTDFLEALIGLVGDDDRMVSEGATWVLKSELETGKTLDEDLTGRLIAGVDKIMAWQAQLHICQIVAYLEVPESTHVSLHKWLTQRLNADRPFLRAWALDGLCHLPGSAAEAHLDRMADDPSASVRARVRNLRKKVARCGRA